MTSSRCLCPSGPHTTLWPLFTPRSPQIFFLVSHTQIASVP